MSRSYSINLQHYEKIHQMKFDDTLAGKVHFEKMKDFLVSNIKAPALLGFIEMCNHIHSSDEMEKHGFYIIPQPGKMTVKVPGSYKKGQEINFQYQNELTSYKTVFFYGFYYKENPFKKFSLPLNFHINHFTKQKFEIGKELGIIPNPYIMEGFYNQNLKDNLSFEVEIINKEDMKLMNLLKLIIFNSDHISIDDVKDRLRNNKALDYNSEIMSSAYLRTSLVNYNTKRKTFGLVIFLIILFL